MGALGYIVSKLDPADTANMVGIAHRKVKKQTLSNAANITVKRTSSGWSVMPGAGLALNRIAVIDARGRVLASVRRPKSYNARILLPVKANGVFTVVAYSERGIVGTVRIAGVGK